MKIFILQAITVFLMFAGLSCYGDDSPPYPDESDLEWWSTINKKDPSHNVPSGSGVKVCSGYMAPTNCSGGRRGRSATSRIRHEGMDFAAKAGTPVLAGTYGTVYSKFVHRSCGETLQIKSDKLVKIPPIQGFGERVTNLYVLYTHIKFKENPSSKAAVKLFAKVKPGDVIGYVDRTKDRDCIGKVPHVHMELNTLPDWISKMDEGINPNRFWYDGPGMVTCYDPDRIFSDKYFALVAPIACKPNT